MQISASGEVINRTIKRVHELNIDIDNYGKSIMSYCQTIDSIQQLKRVVGEARSRISFLGKSACFPIIRNFDTMIHQEFQSNHNPSRIPISLSLSLSKCSWPEISYIFMVEIKYIY